MPRFFPILAGRGLLVLAAGLSPLMSASPSPPPLPSQFAVFGGGCFWCVEAVFEHAPGVRSVQSGYAGGHTAHPTYEQIGAGETGHAEVVRVEFDPGRVSYAELCALFFDAHDPTTRHRQGADVGPHYRSILLFADEAQRATALREKEAAQQLRDRPIVTEIAPLDRFWPAELYHQDYYKNNPRAGYCQVVIRPKLEKLQQKGRIAPARQTP